MFDDSNFAVAVETPTNPLVQLARNGPVFIKNHLTRPQFHAFLLQNGDVKIERDRQGTITIHPPMTLKSGNNEGKPFAFLMIWSMLSKNGEAFSPSTAFDLPDGSTYKADGAWISNKKRAQLSEEEWDSIALMVPDFVIETRSKTDSLTQLKKKMTDVWMANGVRLAWLLDPKSQKAWIYRADGSVESVANFETVLSGETVLPGFELDLRELK